MGRKLGSKNKNKLEKLDKPKKFIVPWKFRKDTRFDLATFIIHKFLDARLIESKVWESYTSAFKLVKKFNSKPFWASLPCEFKIKNISNLLFGKAFDKLNMLWIVYQRDIARDKKIKIDAAPPIEYKLEEIDIEESITQEKKPKTILEFCK